MARCIQPALLQLGHQPSLLCTPISQLTLLCPQVLVTPDSSLVMRPTSHTYCCYLPLSWASLLPKSVACSRRNDESWVQTWAVIRHTRLHVLRVGFQASAIPGRFPGTCVLCQLLFGASHSTRGTQMKWSSGLLPCPAYLFLLLLGRNHWSPWVYSIPTTSPPHGSVLSWGRALNV
jgi:hypothetical protein